MSMQLLQRQWGNCLHAESKSAVLRPDWAIMFCSWVRLLQYLSFNSQVWMGTRRLAIPYITTPFLYKKFLSVLSFHWFTVLLSVQVSNSVPSMDKRDTIANSMLVLIITLQTGKGFLCANEVTLTTKKEHWKFLFYIHYQDGDDKPL